MLKTYVYTKCYGRTVPDGTERISFSIDADLEDLTEDDKVNIKLDICQGLGVRYWLCVFVFPLAFYPPCRVFCVCWTEKHTHVCHVSVSDAD
jgi:hypothetical protein